MVFQFNSGFVIWEKTNLPHSTSFNKFPSYNLKRSGLIGLKKSKKNFSLVHLLSRNQKSLVFTTLNTFCFLKKLCLA